MFRVAASIDGKVAPVVKHLPTNSGDVNFYAEYIMRNAGLKEAQAGIKIARRKSKTSDMQMTPPLWQKVKRN